MVLIIGIVFLIKGADFFVSGSSDIAKRLKIPSFIIGMTVVSIGTSLPEFSVSTIASISGKNELAISNVTGSNIFNILMVIGVCALLTGAAVDDDTIKRDLPFLFFSQLILLAPFFISLITGDPNMAVGRPIGAVLAIMFVYYIVAMIRRAKNFKQKETDLDAPAGSVVKSIVLIVVGAAGIIIGGDLTVDCASRIALTFGMSQTLVGLTIVSVGTSLPELVTSVVAIKKGELGIALGNGIGSCIFNVLMIVGFASLISPIALTFENVIDIFILEGITILTAVFCITDRKIKRWEGAVMVALYVAYMAYIIVR